MENDILKILEDTNSVLNGHFCLTSGKHSDVYFQCAKLYQYPKILEKLGKILSENLKDTEYDTIVSPALGAVIMGYETAKQADKRFLFVERKDGTMQLRRGYSLRKGEKVVIVEDVITTARTIYETYDAIKEFECEVVAIGCIVDRTQGKTEFDIKSLLKMQPVLYDPNDCPLCKKGIPIEKPGSRATQGVLSVK